MIATRSHEQPENRLDLLAGEPEFPGALMPVAQQLALATGIANLEPVLTLVGGHLRHQRHALRHDLQQVPIECIDHGAHNRQRSRRISHEHAERHASRSHSVSRRGSKRES